MATEFGAETVTRGARIVYTYDERRDGGRKQKTNLKEKTAGFQPQRLQSKKLRRDPYDLSFLFSVTPELQTKTNRKRADIQDFRLAHLLFLFV